jgi:hypothetical protein
MSTHVSSKMRAGGIEKKKMETTQEHGKKITMARETNLQERWTSRRDGENRAGKHLPTDGHGPNRGTVWPAREAGAADRPRTRTPAAREAGDFKHTVYERTEPSE